MKELETLLRLAFMAGENSGVARATKMISGNKDYELKTFEDFIQLPDVRFLIANAEIRLKESKK